MAKFNTLANETHNIYGTSRNAEDLEYLLKNNIFANITNHKTIISTKAKPGFFSPKNIIDQSAFSTN